MSRTARKSKFGLLAAWYFSKAKDPETGQWTGFQRRTLTESIVYSVDETYHMTDLARLANLSSDAPAQAMQPSEGGKPQNGAGAQAVAAEGGTGNGDYQPATRRSDSAFPSIFGPDASRPQRDPVAERKADMALAQVFLGDGQKRAQYGPKHGGWGARA